MLVLESYVLESRMLESGVALGARTEPVACLFCWCSNSVLEAGVRICPVPLVLSGSTAEWYSTFFQWLERQPE